MTFLGIANTAAALVIERLGEAVTYTDAASAAHSINALIDVDFDELGNAIMNTSRRISLSRADAPTIKRGETITAADSTVYTIEDIILDDGVVVTVSGRV